MRNDLTKPYDWFSNRPDQHSEDFRNVMDWLKAHGATEPKVVYIDLSSGGFPPGTVNPGPIMYLQYEGYPSPFDASQVLNAPGVVLIQLGLAQNVLNYAPPVAPTPPAPPPPGQPANPIGAPWFVDRDGLQVYYPAEGDRLSNGTQWPSGNPKYVKSLIPGPWGDYASWKALR